MKIFKLIAIPVLIVAVLSVGAYAQPTNASADSIIRIHIRANDDSAEEQNIKLQVRDAVNEYLSPILNQCINKEEAERALQESIGEIEKIGKQVSGEDVNANLRTEEFPARTYGDIVYPAGKYEALIVEIGTGAGANWWCVAFPPMCYTSSKPSANGNNAIQAQKPKVTYHSFILDWLNSLKKQGGK